MNIMVAPISYDWAALLVRLAIALALLPYGIKKFRNQDGADKFPAVLFFTSRQAFYSAMLIEILVPCCLIFGFLTRIAAIAGVCNMGVAFTVSKDKYLTSPATSFCLCLVAILFIGPGGYSLDALMFG